MAPPSKPTKIKNDLSKKFQKGKAKKKKKKSKSNNGSNKTTVQVDNTAVDTEWWEIFWNKNSSDLASKTPLDKDQAFKHFFRVSKKTFEYICSLVHADLISRPPSGLINIEGRLLSVEKQVAIALRRLASGESQVSVGASFGVGQSTVSQVTWRFVEAAEARALHHLRWPGPARATEIKSCFESSFGLPNCCGVLGTARVVMTLPAVQTSDDWVDSDSNYSMFVQGVVDCDFRFLDIVTGWPGGMPVSRLLKFSGFYKLCESRARLNGSSLKLPGGQEVGEYVVGGPGYPLLPWLLTPPSGSDEGSDFDRAHERALSVAREAFSRLKGGWRILNKVMWRPDRKKLPSIILVCCLLHNIIIDCGDRLAPDVALLARDDLGGEGCVCKQVDPLGKAMRENLAKHFSSGKGKGSCA